MLKVLSIPTHDSTGVLRKPEFVGVIIHAYGEGAVAYLRCSAVRLSHSAIPVANRHALKRVYKACCCTFSFRDGEKKVKIQLEFIFYSVFLVL